VLLSQLPNQHWHIKDTVGDHIVTPTIIAITMPEEDILTVTDTLTMDPAEVIMVVRGNIPFIIAYGLTIALI
tara:strand:- start:772 stop:987 length:216 start_codon:yes stop_codon:yes gene_type:complete